MAGVELREDKRRLAEEGVDLTRDRGRGWIGVEVRDAVTHRSGQSAGVQMREDASDGNLIRDRRRELVDPRDDTR